MATFTSLPAELVEYVYAYLTQPDLHAVCQVNKASHALAIPFLYRNIDLYLRPGDKVPRIDWVCLNVAKDQRLAARVETVRLGPSPEKEVKEGQRWLPQDRHFDDKAMFRLAMEALETESLVAKGDYLRDALIMREYAAYAVLIIMMLPSLRGLYIADFDCATLDHLHTALRNLDSGTEWNPRHASEKLMHRLASINEVSFNVDKLSGMAYPRGTVRSNLGPILKLPGFQVLEMSIRDGLERSPRAGMMSQWNSRILGISGKKLTNITTLVFRHSEPALQTIQPLLDATPQLQSFTYDFFYDCSGREDAAPNWLNLSAWSDSLPLSLKVLVFGVENCDTSAFPFKQPRIGEKLFGYLDLTRHTNLHTIEVPFPFLTGDANFSITSEIYPLLPPNLLHLSLRTDMSNAQHQFPFDTSRLPQALTFQESEDEARHLINARMDVSYMFHAAMVFLDFATNLETISVWQPADNSLSWFDGQIEDFAQTCRNRSVKGLMVYPMMLRWKKQEHWNLVEEVELYDPRRPSASHHKVLHRGERGSIPLGLATQYHLHALQNHQLRIR
jgi:hypothetical protein